MRKKFLLFLTVTLIISSIILLFPSQVYGVNKSPCEKYGDFVTLTVKAGSTNTPTTFITNIIDLAGISDLEFFFLLFKYDGTCEELLSEDNTMEFLVAEIYPEDLEEWMFIYDEASDTLTITFSGSLGKGQYHAFVWARKKYYDYYEIAGDYVKFSVSDPVTEPEPEPEPEPVIYYKNPDGFIRYMYKNILSRDPEEAGLKAWHEMLIIRGFTAADLVKSFIFGEECGEVFLNYSNEEFLNFMYKVILWREPEESEINTWLSLMESGMTREELVDKFTQSGEFASLWKQFGVIPYPGYTETE
jgi:hypothetical protein